MTRAKERECIAKFRNCLVAILTQKGSSISRQNFNENLDALHLVLTIFYHLPGFCLKTGFLNPYLLSLILMELFLRDFFMFFVTFFSLCQKCKVF